MKFQTRHYIEIARILRETRPHRKEYEARKRWNIIVENFVFAFIQDNKKFNPSRFKEAAGYEE